MKPSPAYADLFRKAIKDYRWDDPKDRGMCQMYTKDRKDMRAVLKAYLANDWCQARLLASRMDTFPREYIPQQIWDQLFE